MNSLLLERDLPEGMDALTLRVRDDGVQAG